MEPLTLRPDPVAAFRWSVGGVVLVALGVWFVLDSGGAPQLWALFGVMVAVAGWFVAQLVAPAWFEVHVDDVGVRARTGWHRIDVPWDRVQRASLRTFAGEPYLRLDLIEEVEGGWIVAPSPVVLPLGADPAALRMAIAQVRARGGAAVPEPAA